MKKSFLFGMVVLSMAFSSCSSILYQVYEVESPNLNISNNSMVYQNEDCKVSYNLWDKQGAMTFIFENLTDKDIFIDMSQSFFIKNGSAYDYFQNRTWESRVYESVEIGVSTSTTYIGTSGYWPSRYSVSVAKSAAASANAGRSTDVSIHEQEFVCVPAKAFKVLGIYKIYPEFETTCNRAQDYPKTEATLSRYNENDSPLKFSNRLAYSFEEGNKNLTHIDHYFWLKSVKNFSQKAAIESKNEKVGCSSMTAKNYYFKIGGPNQFYVPYSSSGLR